MTTLPDTSTAARTLEVYDSSARPSAFVDELLALIRFRDLIGQLISRNIKTRYKRSFLGIAWTMVNPLLMMAVLTLVFSQIFHSSVPDYALYALSGLIIWNFFAQSTTAAMSDLVWSGGLIGRIFIPKSVFAVSAVGTGLVNLVLALVPYGVIALLFGARPSPTLLWLPLPILASLLFTLGVALLVSTAAVYFADVMPMYEIALTIWLYLTPVIYPVSMVPARVLSLLRLNPVFYLVQAFRSVVYEGRAPLGSGLTASFVVGLAILLLGWWIFTRKAREYVYRV
ncbi:MAG: ABC transporter permease [Actinobacteria bacterium]|nr:ABC transporter permease [Actinomycetota bacterium]